ncbi:MAG: hypothetical protein ABIL05_02560 [candidate division WOR-3 bacterium]
MVKRVFHKAANFEDAEKYDILQHRMMGPGQRQRVAHSLRIKVFGRKNPDVRENRYYIKRYIENIDDKA